jgi:predicted RND superfamily exporter protein
MNAKLRNTILIGYALLAILAAYSLFNLKFGFDFSKFFPQDDPDLAFFEEFVEEFEADDNFLLVAVEAPTGKSVFDTAFLNDFHRYTLALQSLPLTGSVLGLTKIRYPLRTPFGLTSTPALHRNDPARLVRDSARIMNDERFVYNLISPDAKTLAMVVRTTEDMTLGASDSLMNSVQLTTLNSGFSESQTHYLGRAFFQSELVKMQKREIRVSSIISGILVTMILFLIYRRWRGVLIAMVSIGLGLLLFFGILSVFGRELSAMAALYPVLMIIVGTSDVIHLMTKYVDELRFGKSQRDALRITLKEIGLATFLTSATTAIGFATLLTSRVGPIRDFGVNAGIGVLVAYITVITFTMALLTLFNQDQIMRTEGTVENWDKWLLRLNVWVKNNTRIIAWGTTAAVIISLIGISMVNTNYSIIGNMPRGAKITSDLQFYESEFTGFRPFELAVFAQPGYKVTDFKVLQEMDKIENAMRAEPALRAISSQTALVKSVNQAMTGGTPEDYRLPEDEAAFAKIAPMLARAPSSASAVLVNKNGDKARISSRALDIGSDSIRNMAARIANFGKTELDTSVIKVQETGTGLLLDKNSVYVRESLLWGLGGAVLLISFLMALLFRDWKMLFVALVPNILPLLLAGALLGFLGIDLEAGIAIVFAIIFGIAVDDSIHFLAKYRLVRGRGIGQDEAIATTFRESGKAIILTSLILFFGFLSLLFSVHPPSVAIGLLISVTLASAVLADLLIIPVMLRWLVK